MTGQTTLEYLVSRGDNICVIKKKICEGQSVMINSYNIILLYIGMCMHMYITFFMLRGERRRASSYIFFYNLIDN